MTLMLRAQHPGSPAARTLIEHDAAELWTRWPGGRDAPPVFDADGLVPPDGLFLVALVAGEPAGCAGIRTLSPAWGSSSACSSSPPTAGAGSHRPC